MKIIGYIVFAFIGSVLGAFMGLDSNWCFSTSILLAILITVCEKSDK